MPWALLHESWVQSLLSSQSLLLPQVQTAAKSSQQEPSLCLSVHDRKPELLREVWVVHTRERIRSEIDDLMTERNHERLE